MPLRRLIVVAPGALLAAAALAPASADEGIPLVADDPSALVRFDEGKHIVVAALPEQGEGYLSLARRLCGDEEKRFELEAANDGRALVLGRTVDVPWDLLRDEFRYLALRALFPEDRAEKGGWIHVPGRARGLNHSEGLWEVATWFTGEGGSWQKIAEANGLSGPFLPRGREVRVPEELLSPLFRTRKTNPDGSLAYGRDDGGEYAEYVLRKGEALYTAVVLKFTGFVDPSDVLEAAEAIRERSGIRDVRDIPVGFKVRVPLDMLALPYLPDNHPRRLIARVYRSEMQRLPSAARQNVGSLAGVHILLDPGHGGADIGATSKRIWESDYVYDVACRMKRTIERETAATVHMLVEDPEHRCKVFDSKRLVANRKEVVMTSPPHRANGKTSTTVGVNLRWYLANSIHRRLVNKKDVDPNRVVFLSLHADSLHKGVRGGMVYVPGASYRSGSHKGYGDSRYRKYSEWKEQPKTSFSRKERLRDEAASRKLAEAILDGYRAEKLPVHKNRPIRDHIVRGTGRRAKRWVPAVLRGNAVPAKVLVETVNINNASDAALLESPEGRERIAHAVVRGIRGYFGDEGPAIRRERLASN